MGKRSLVIVDTPCVHQLLEAFVSKLYAQSYSFCSLEVSHTSLHTLEYIWTLPHLCRHLHRAPINSYGAHHTTLATRLISIVLYFLVHYSSDPHIYWECVVIVISTFININICTPSLSSLSLVTSQVHGASGMDHFVHRFTHRVARGLLIAVGRPDGRLCCLAKSEAAILLSAKQVCVCVCSRVCLWISVGGTLECFECLAMTWQVSWLHLYLWWLMT